MVWEIEFYETSRGDRPVEDFINSLPIEAKSKVVAVVEALKEFGVVLGLPHAKKLAGTDLWELRTGGKSASRILYVAVVGKKFILLHGFLKKTEKTPEGEIGVGLRRLMEYKSRLTI